MIVTSGVGMSKFIVRVIVALVIFMMLAVMIDPNSSKYPSAIWTIIVGFSILAALIIGSNSHDE